MVLIFIKSADTLAVDNKTFEWLSVTINQFNWFTPNPETFSAGVYGGSNSETIVVLLLKKYSIQQE